MATKYPYKILVAKNTGTCLKPLPSASVRVFESGTTTEKPAYATALSTAPLAQPLTSDVSGELAVYLESGFFRVETTFPNMPTEIFEDFLPDPTGVSSTYLSTMLMKVVDGTIDLLGASSSASSFIPDGAWVFGVTHRVLSEALGVTGFDLGIPGNQNAFGENLPPTSGSVGGPEVFKIQNPFRGDGATDVVATAVGGLFTGGKLRVSLHYIEVTPPLS